MSPKILCRCSLILRLLFSKWGKVKIRNKKKAQGEQTHWRTGTENSSTRCKTWQRWEKEHAKGSCIFFVSTGQLRNTKACVREEQCVVWARWLLLDAEGSIGSMEETQVLLLEDCVLAPILSLLNFRGSGLQQILVRKRPSINDPSHPQAVTPCSADCFTRRQKDARSTVAWEQRQSGQLPPPPSDASSRVSPL